jgi:pimeloyl-ACP methyl ester carboxylesterase
MLGRSAAFAVERLVAPVEGMHRAINRRWLEPLGASGVPDAAVAGVYASIRAGARFVGAGVDATDTVGSETVDGFQAVVNGLWGDAFHGGTSRLEIPMGIRDADGLSHPTGRVVVLVHGLFETERCWRGREDAPGLADLLDDHHALTPISIRYNSGLRVSDNGERLAALLEEVLSEWPVPIESIALIGHSMGGLVIRSACTAAQSAGHVWIDDLDDIVTVAAPHRGSPLEKAANVAAWGLGFARTTRPLADFLNGRSVGIKDLRFGAIVEDDWEGTDPDALLRNTVGDHHMPAGVVHHVVAGVTTSDPTHPVGVVVGDFVVRTGSSTAGLQADTVNVAIHGGRNHFNLVGDPEVIERVLNWLSGPTPADR